MGGRSLGSTLGRWFEQHAPWAKWPVILAIVLGTALWIALTVRKEKRAKEGVAGKSFRSFTRNGERRTLHLVAPEAAPPTDVAGQLRPFDTAADAYGYVYVQFGEALYDRILVHVPGADDAEFVRDASLSDEQNAARLASLMHPAASLGAVTAAAAAAGT